jgi:hypothetical protein
MLQASKVSYGGNPQTEATPHVHIFQGSFTLLASRARETSSGHLAGGDIFRGDYSGLR